MKKSLQQSMFEFGAPEEPQVPAENIPVANTAPTPPLIIEITEDEEDQPAVQIEEDTASTAAITLADDTSEQRESEPVTLPQTDLLFFEDAAPASPDEGLPLINIVQETPTEEKSAQAAEPPVQPKRISSTRGRKSLKETAITADLIQVPEDDVLFSKQYYSIGEVATMFRENQSLIRYWETEFDILQPKKNKKGDRFFRPVDIKNLVLIYDLLRRRKFTIEGAKDFLKRNKKAEDKFGMIQSLEKVKTFLLELRSNL